MVTEITPESIVLQLDFTIAKLKRYDDGRYATFLDECEFLLEAIPELGRRLAEDLGVQGIWVQTTRQAEQRLDDVDEVRAYWSQVCDQQQKTWLRALAKRGMAHATFEEFIQSVSVELRARLRRQLRLEAWNRCKGRVFEWGVLLALLDWNREELRVEGDRLVIGSRPLCFEPGGRPRYLWYQKPLKAHLSGLKAVPDFLYTYDEGEPRVDNIESVVECKNVKELTSAVLRKEAGKSLDLAVGASVLVPFRPVSEPRRRAAAALGLDVVPNPLCVVERMEYLQKKRDAFTEVGAKIEQALEEKRFEKLQQEKRARARRKHAPR